MSELVAVLGALFSGGLGFLLSLLGIFLAALFVILVVSPFESLQWWAGWVRDVPATPPAGPSPSPATAAAGRGCYVVFLSGGGVLGTRIDAWERRLVDRLTAGLPAGTVLAGIFPFTVRDDTLVRGRRTAWFWRCLPACGSGAPAWWRG
jgi:hypothetical protein